MAQKLSDETKRKKLEYIREYEKKHYKKINIQIKKEEAEELEKLLKKRGISKADLLREAIEKLK